MAYVSHERLAQPSLQDDTAKLSERFSSQPDEFISAKEAGAILRQGEGAIRQKLNEGKIRGLKVGGRIWIWKPSLKNVMTEY
jgi:hypothetical protein